MMNPRAETSRRNGARSSGPVTPDGRARSARNALRHGLRASTIAVPGNEGRAECLRLAAALREELAPAGELQEHLADQRAAPHRPWWSVGAPGRPPEVASGSQPTGARRGFEAPDFGLLPIRDRNGARALDMLLRYRGSVQTELFRALAALKALQAEAAATTPVAWLPPGADSTERTQSPLCASR